MVEHCLLQNISSYWDTACQWVRESATTWKAWLPHNLSNKTVITIGGMFPITAQYTQLPGIVPGECSVLCSHSESTALDMFPAVHSK